MIVWKGACVCVCNGQMPCNDRVERCVCVCGIDKCHVMIVWKGACVCVIQRAERADSLGMAGGLG